uniref:C-type lectin domain-containing protein n=1 Tax=Timema genevievae TaxID=629358 RepID=A0A7R9JWB5_TIMGE|nr:unnamed protein product [Timema genevievae]
MTSVSRDMSPTMHVILCLATVGAVLVSTTAETSGIDSSTANFTLQDSLSAIIKNLKPDLEEETKISLSAQMKGLWSPMLEESAFLPRDQKVMKQKLTSNFINMRPPSDGGTRPMRPNVDPGMSSNNKEVSETDLYLLGAIEKLVYRVDFMEKRLRRTEELLYYVMAGSNNANNEEDPCPGNFTRAGKNCYHFSVREFNWKSSASMCKSLGSTLAELESIEENQDVVTFIQANSYLRGKDYWTGGLNPGLLWIWANSARPVSSNSSSADTNIIGEGRCLKLAYNPATRSYVYQGADCSGRINYICEYEDNRTSRVLQRIGEAIQQQQAG